MLLSLSIYIYIYILKKKATCDIFPLFLGRLFTNFSSYLLKVQGNSGLCIYIYIYIYTRIRVKLPHGTIVTQNGTVFHLKKFVKLLINLKIIKILIIKY